MKKKMALAGIEPVSVAVVPKVPKNGRWEKQVFWHYKHPHILPRSIRNSSFGTIMEENNVIHPPWFNETNLHQGQHQLVDH